MKNPNEFLQAMGKRIATARKALGMTQEQLAEKADVSVGVISTAERGIKALRPENIAKIASVLGVSCDYLLTGTVTEQETISIPEKVAALSDEQKRSLFAVFDAALQMMK